MTTEADVDTSVARLHAYLEAGAAGGVKRAQDEIRTVLGTERPHDFDELIGALFVFLAALVGTRAKDLAYTTSTIGAASPPPRRVMSEETRARMSEGQRRRKAREKLEREGGGS